MEFIEMIEKLARRYKAISQAWLQSSRDAKKGYQSTTAVFEMKVREQLLLEDETHLMGMVGIDHNSAKLVVKQILEEGDFVYHLNWASDDVSKLLGQFQCKSKSVFARWLTPTKEGLTDLINCYHKYLPGARCSEKPGTESSTIATLSAVSDSNTHHKKGGPEFTVDWYCGSPEQIILVPTHCCVLVK